jgi:hypothetical protein
MAYTIVKSDGTVLTTIADGTINTTSTSLGLPGRNYAGYGQTLDTNFVHMMENFADTTPPSNPLRGQLWFDTNANTLYVCPADGTSNANLWLALTSTASGGTTTFGAVTVTGNLQANNITALNNITGANGVFTNISVSANANITTGNLTSAVIGTTTTTAITTGANTTAGALTGTWTANGGGSGNTIIVTNGNLVVTGASTGIKTDNYYYANGSPFNPSGTYTNANVFDYLTGSNAVSQFTGNIAPTKVTTSNIAGGGTIFGIWTLGAGARLQATYADFAERFEADATYDPGTVVELGGDKEITSVKYDLSEDVFGVVSDTAAYILNATAGDDKTHPAIAVSGRVKVKVIGKVAKGARLVSAGNGIARQAQKGEASAFNTIGRALEHKTDDDLGTVEAIVVIK